MQIVTIVPCYDVEKFCSSVLEGVRQHSDIVIPVNDGSCDGTEKILQNFTQRHPGVTQLITFPQNRGKGVALLEGMRVALASFSFDVLITLDGDGQHDPSYIHCLAALIKGGADLAIGMRTLNEMPLKNRIANTIITFLLHRLYPHAPHDTQSGYRAFNRKFVEMIVEQVHGHRYEMEFECLLLALSHHLHMRSCSIPTVYLDHNRSSHFSGVADSVLILKALWHHWRMH